MGEGGEQREQNINPLEERPGILIVGSPNVGKRTIISRLLSVEIDDSAESSSEVVAYGWTINTKYYTADVSIWIAHFHDDFSMETLSMINNLVALVMVFDLNDLSSLAAIQNWVSHTDIQKFEILLCMGNKVDLVPGHPAHAEYKRRLQKKFGDSYTDPYSELGYGINESEGTSLLGAEEPSCEFRRSCVEWCSQHNIEYIEVCASNANFDKCLSVDGDSQGVERLYVALSAHMWPGMILKSGDKITLPSLPETQDMSSEESDYDLEYEILSGGSAEPWNDMAKEDFSFSGSSSVPHIGESSHQSVLNECHAGNGTVCGNKELKSPTSNVAIGDEIGRRAGPNAEEIKEDKEPNAEEMNKDREPNAGEINREREPNAEEINKEREPNAGGISRNTESDQDKHVDFEDLEQLMSEIGNMRSNMRLMPDFQRREMAAQLALKMAAMFGGLSDEELDET